MQLKIRVLFLLLVFFNLCKISAQSKEEEKFKDNFNDLILLMDDKSYHKAIPVAKSLVKSDPDNPHFNYLAGYCIYQENVNTKEAIPYFEKAILTVERIYNRMLITEDNAPIDSYYYLAKSYQIDYQLDNAIFHYNLFLEKAHKKNRFIGDAKKQIDNCNYAKHRVSKPVRLEIQNLGKGVNSAFSDYSPVVSIDEQTIFFTSRRLREDSSNYYYRDYKDGGYFEDIYFSKKDEKGVWGKAQLVDFSRKDNHEATLNLRNDGKVLYVYRDDKGDGNLYESEYDEEDSIWTEPGRIIGSNINTKFHETHMTTTEDQQMMCFVSDREGGQGGKDIYRVVILPDGEWSKPLNLGPVINTPEDEDGPFISPDGKTLYFSSKGHKGMGGYDIFYSEFIDSTNSWSEPKHLGYPINSTDDDVFFVVSKDGHRAYYSSLQNKDGFGEKDIYMINHLEAVKKELTLIKGYVIAAKNQPFPRDIEILVRENETGEMRQISKPQPKNGSFLFLVLPGFEYNVVFKRGEEEVFNENVFIEYGTAFKETHEVIPLGPVDIRTKEEKEADLKGIPIKTESTETSKNENTQKLNAKEDNKVDKKGVVFRVQIGAYLNDDKASLDKVYKVLQGYEEIKSNKVTTFVMGSFKSYEEAVDHKDKIVGLGINDAFVVAFKNGKKIDVSKAIEEVSK